MTSGLEPRLTLRRALVLLFVVLVFALTGLLSNYGNEVKALLGIRRQSVHQIHIPLDNEGHYMIMPEIFVERGIYPNHSFANEAGVVPAFWEGENNQTIFSGIKTPTIGPCYSYRKKSVDWEAEIAKYNSTGQLWYHQEKVTKANGMDVEGYCRPGFLIIGAGKCGTSSLYHYISQHPKVLPASHKQIHYFKYHMYKPLKWYYQHFPTTASFLSAGALLTGEASPGYLPYPDVVMDMKKRMQEPRLLAIGRNPLERSFSSYKYNYVNPHIEYLRKGKVDSIPKNKPDEFYTQFLFSFEDMMRAELVVLRECFASGSKAEKKTRKNWARVTWVKEEYRRREEEGLPHLIDLDGFCYGRRVNDTVLRRQWANITSEQPDKVILDHNTHLTQSLIGRSLYLFPLEWWYTAFSKDHIYFVCTEELEDLSGESMNSVGQFLGLPRFENFSGVVQEGAYNVGTNTGYGRLSSWSELENEHKNETVPLSANFRQELEEFIRPYNERLFAMTGRRCKW